MLEGGGRGYLEAGYVQLSQTLFSQVLLSSRVHLLSPASLLQAFLVILEQLDTAIFFISSLKSPPLPP